MKTQRLIYFTLINVLLLGCSPSDDKHDSSNTNEIEKDSLNPVEEVDKVVYTYGIDISSFQNQEIETLEVDSLSFVICRATDGITFTDEDFENNWETALNKGFIRGAYHFFESDDDPQAQVNHYLSVVDDLSANDLPPIVDFEDDGIHESQTDQEVIETLLKTLQILEKETNRTPIVYVNVYNGNKYLAGDEFADYTLWIADYSGNSSPEMPGAWSEDSWVLWQQSSDYMINDVKNDLDLFNGSVSELKSFIKHN